MLGILQVNYLIIIFINLLLCFVVLASIKKPLSYLKAKLYFLGIIISIIFWLVSLLVLNTSTDMGTIFFVGRFAFVGPNFIMLSLYSFTSLFPLKLKLPKVELRLIWIFSIIGASISMTELVIKDIKTQEGSLVPEFGQAYFFYTITLLAPLLLSFRNLYLNFKKSNFKEKQQIKLLAVGFGITVITAMTTNLVIPLVTGNATSSLFGPYSVIPFLLFISISILRYRFLDIRFLLGKFIYFTLQALLLFSGFYLFNIIYNLLFGTPFTIEAIILGIPLSYAFMALYTGFNQLIREYTDTRLINPGYNPLELLDQYNREVSVIVELKTLAEKSLEVIAKTIRPELSAIMVETSENQWQDFSYKKQKDINLNDFKSVINIWSEHDTRPIFFDYLDLDILDRFSTMPHIITELKNAMEKHTVRVLYPFIENKKLFGILILGQKDGDSPYTIQDVKFLDSFANALSLSINRSLLYKEIQDFNIELQKQVEDATRELKIKNKSLEDAIANLEEVRRQERDMIDVMGHELRTPISIVRNALLVLDSKYKNSKGQVDKDTLGKYLDMAVESVRREITLIETLLSATKVEGNRIQLQLTKVDLLDVVCDSLEALKRDAIQKGLKVIYNPPKEKIYIYADRVRVQEIMDNFLNNAIKYTPKGQIEIIISTTATTGIVDVKDTGVGISKTDIEKLGRKFFRAQPHYSAEHGARPSGTGLGLYVTFELIDAMGGERRVSSEVGKGSTFGFSFPLYTNQPDQHVDQTFMTDPGLAKKAVKQ